MKKVTIWLKIHAVEVAFKISFRYDDGFEIYEILEAWITVNDSSIEGGELIMDIDKDKFDIFKLEERFIEELEKFDNI
jgi:hypothetical protein